LNFRVRTSRSKRTEDHKKRTAREIGLQGIQGYKGNGEIGSAWVLTGIREVLEQMVCSVLQGVQGDDGLQRHSVFRYREIQQA
jgi:hypothetical protein